MQARAGTFPFAVKVGHFILVVRRHRVLLDEDLAKLYGVDTRALLQAVKRNIARFPPDFMFELSRTEWTALRSQSVISKRRRGGRRYAPYAFTEQGVAMLSSVVSSDRAIALAPSSPLPYSLQIAADHQFQKNGNHYFRFSVS
jgi:hypothetical protein